MPDIKIFGNHCQLEQGENLLDGLLRQGIRVPHSCRSGICHSCLLKLEQGTPPEGSQRTLTPEQVKNNYILACQSKVSDNLYIGMVSRDEMPATITDIESITPTCIAITLSPRFPLVNHHGNVRPTAWLDADHSLNGRFPIESISPEGREIRIVLERKAGDPFSAWIHEQASPGSQVMLRITWDSENPGTLST